MDRTRTDRILRWLEHGLLILGAACLIWAGAISMRALTWQAEQNARLASLDPSRELLVDDSSRDADAPHEAPAPIGRLEIPRVGLSAVVMQGDDASTLDVAVGHLPDTPLPWQEGNTALAGHRDTFFRPIRHVRPGDDMRLVTPRGTFRYRATRQMVVEPHELWVLDSTQPADLTLITCYPFNGVGPAPRRFVVHAERIAHTNEAPAGAGAQQDGRP